MASVHGQAHAQPAFSAPADLPGALWLVTSALWLVDIVARATTASPQLLGGETAWLFGAAVTATLLHGARLGARSRSDERRGSAMLLAGLLLTGAVSLWVAVSATSSEVDVPVLLAVMATLVLGGGAALGGALVVGHAVGRHGRRLGL